MKGAAAADRSMWAEMESDWEHFALELQQATIALDLPVEESQDEERDYTGTDKLAQTKTRVGQNFFRRSVLSAYRNRCCIPRLAVPKLLVASHMCPGGLIPRTNSIHVTGFVCRCYMIKLLMLR